MEMDLANQTQINSKTTSSTSKQVEHVAIQAVQKGVAGRAIFAYVFFSRGILV